MDILMIRIVGYVCVCFRCINSTNEEKDTRRTHERAKERERKENDAIEIVLRLCKMR